MAGELQDVRRRHAQASSIEKSAVWLISEIRAASLRAASIALGGIRDAAGVVPLALTYGNVSPGSAGRGPRPAS